MPTSAKKRHGASSKRASKPVKKASRRAASRGKKKDTALAMVTAAEEAAFTEALIASGQAAPLDKNGKLPRGATHKIVEDQEGNITVVRRRFSIT